MEVKEAESKLEAAGFEVIANYKSVKKRENIGFYKCCT